MFRIIRQQWLLWFYLLLTGSIIAAFIKPLEFAHTTAGIIVGTIITTVGAVLLAAVPAYLVAGVLAGIIRLPRLVAIADIGVGVHPGRHAVDHPRHYRISAVLQHPGVRLVHVVGHADPAAVVVPHLGDRVFERAQTVQRALRQGRGILRRGAVGVLFRLSPAYQKGKILDVLVLGWATSLGDTAAVMLTCGALTAFPDVHLGLGQTAELPYLPAGNGGARRHAGGEKPLAAAHHLLVVSLYRATRCAPPPFGGLDHALSSRAIGAKPDTAPQDSKHMCSCYSMSPSAAV
jgi:hypothetical protein